MRQLALCLIFLCSCGPTTDDCTAKSPCSADPAQTPDQINACEVAAMNSATTKCYTQQVAFTECTVRDPEGAVVSQALGTFTVRRKES